MAYDDSKHWSTYMCVKCDICTFRQATGDCQDVSHYNKIKQTFDNHSATASFFLQMDTAGLFPDKTCKVQFTNSRDQGGCY
jgi:predicted ATP-dependent serine protease